MSTITKDQILEGVAALSVMEIVELISAMEKNSAFQLLLLLQVLLLLLKLQKNKLNSTLFWLHSARTKLQ